MPWRLPSQTELIAKYNGDHSGFQSNVYWSGTTDSGHPQIAYYIDMSNGDVNYNDKTMANYYVRCVR